MGLYDDDGKFFAVRKMTGRMDQYLQLMIRLDAI